MKLTEAQWHWIVEIHRRARTVANLGMFNDFHSSVQLNTAEHSSMQRNEVQFTWRKLEPWRGRSASEASPFNAKESVGICWNVLGSSGIVLKLFNSEARFPFFVRQVWKKRLECVHMCKVWHPKGPPKHLQFTSCCYGGCRQRVSSFGDSPQAARKRVGSIKIVVWRKSDL